MAPKATIASRLAVRRGLSESEAAVYVGISPSYFRELVESKAMPAARKLGKRRIWDIIELDIAFNELPREEENGNARDSWSDYK